LNHEEKTLPRRIYHLQSGEFILLVYCGCLIEELMINFLRIDHKAYQAVAR